MRARRAGGSLARLRDGLVRHAARADHRDLGSRAHLLVAVAEKALTHGVRVDVVPVEYRAEGLVARLRPRLTAGDRVLLPRAAQTRDVLVTALREQLGLRLDARKSSATVWVIERVERPTIN